MKQNFFKKNKQIIINIIYSILLILSSIFTIYKINTSSDLLVVLQWIFEGIVILINLILLLNLCSKYKSKEFKIKVTRLLILTISFCMIICSFVFFSNTNDKFKSEIAELNTIEDKKDIKKENAMSYISLNDSNFTKIDDYNENENKLKIGYVDKIDDDNINYALDAISTNIHKDSFKYNNFNLLIEAFYNKDIDLLLINEEYRENINLIKDTFDKETSIVYQTSLLKSKIEDIEENKTINLIESVLLVGSNNEGEINVSDEANIIELLTISPKTKQIMITDVSSYLNGNIGKDREDELLKYSSKFGTSIVNRNMEDSIGYLVQDHIKFNMSTIGSLMDILETIEVELPDNLKTDNYDFSQGKNILEKEKVISILKEDNFDNDIVLSKFRQEIFVSIINKLSSKEIATYKFNEVLDLLHTLERGISDEFTFNWMNYQLLTDNKWDIKTYNFEYEKDTIRSATKRRRFNSYNITFDSIENFNNTMKKMFDGEKI